MSIEKQTATIFASAARTATPTPIELTRTTHGVHMNRLANLNIVIDVTAVTSTPSVVFSVEAQDSASSKWYSLLDSAAITGTGTTALSLGKGNDTVTNLSKRVNLPTKLRITPVHADADSITYTVGASFETDI